MCQASSNSSAPAARPIKYDHVPYVYDVTYMYDDVTYVYDNVTYVYADKNKKGGASGAAA